MIQFHFIHNYSLWSVLNPKMTQLSLVEGKKRNKSFGQSSVILAIVATVKAYPVHSHSFISLNTPRYFIRKLTFKVFSRFFSKLMRHFFVIVHFSPSQKFMNSLFVNQYREISRFISGDSIFSC